MMSQFGVLKSGPKPRIAGDIVSAQPRLYVFARFWDRVKRPEQFAGMNVKTPDISWY